MYTYTVDIFNNYDKRIIKDWDDSILFFDIVFKDTQDGKHYLLEDFYMDTNPWAGGLYESIRGDEVECTLVEKRKTVVKKWFPVEERNDE